MVRAPFDVLKEKINVKTIMIINKDIIILVEQIIYLHVKELLYFVFFFENMFSISHFLLIILFLFFNPKSSGKSLPLLVL